MFLSCLLKDGEQVDAVTPVGRLFHARVTVTRNDRSPMMLSRVCGTISRGQEPDLSRCRCAPSAGGDPSLPKTDGLVIVIISSYISLYILWPWCLVVGVRCWIILLTSSSSSWSTWTVALLSSTSSAARWTLKRLSTHTSTTNTPHPRHTTTSTSTTTSLAARLMPRPLNVQQQKLMKKKQSVNSSMWLMHIIDAAYRFCYDMNCLRVSVCT